MVDTVSLNSDAGDVVSSGRVIDVDQPRRELPEFVTMSKLDLQAFPSPGTQRALKAETGRDYMALVGPTADSADRTQTQIWTKLRKTIPGLRWSDCEEVGMVVADEEEAARAVDPTRFASFVPSPDSADSGE